MLGEAQIPPTLADAIATEPLWLQAWVMTMVVVHLAAVLFVVARDPQGWRLRIEPIAILASFFVTAVIMGWMYDQCTINSAMFGYSAWRT